MNTTEIINGICSQMGISKAELAKRIGLYPSSLYRKLSKESMTFEELQKCLDVLGVEVELQFKFPDGHRFSSQENHKQIVERMGVLEKKLEAASKEPFPLHLGSHSMTKLTRSNLCKLSNCRGNGFCLLMTMN